MPTEYEKAIRPLVKEICQLYMKQRKAIEAKDWDEAERLRVLFAETYAKIPYPPKEEQRALRKQIMSGVSSAPEEAKQPSLLD